MPQDSEQNLPIERRLLKENPTARNLLYAAVGLALLGAAFWLVLTWLLSDVVNRVFLDGQSLRDVGGLLAAMFGLLVLRMGLMWASDVTAQRSANHIKRN